jgi:hypothetical protein
VITCAVLRALRFDPVEPMIRGLTPELQANLTLASSTGINVVPRLRA